MSAPPPLPRDLEIEICFHGIGQPQRALEPDEDRFWLSTDRFYRLLDEFASWPKCTLSFDDGNSSDVEIALPALRERGLTATFYPLGGRLDEPASVGPDELRELRASHMVIGCHGWAHRPWPLLDKDDLRRELVDAPARLSEVIGEPISTFALPFGRYDRRSITAARRAGVSRLATSDRRMADPRRWLAPRFSVFATDDPTSVRESIAATRRLHRRLELAARTSMKRIR